MATKRPPFEERNYPQSKSPNMFVALTLVAATICGVYVAHHYWAACQDWTFATTCELVKK